MENLALINPEELSFVENNSLNAQQLQFILARTPEQYVHERPAKGGGKWKYVTGGYVKKVLNLMFGFDWDFEVVSEQILLGQVVVKGRLTCRCNGKSITKMQFGSKDIMYKKDSTEALDIGNDFKAATTDALKKCAAEIGIAADIYNAQDFKEVNVNTSEVDHEQLCELFELKKEVIPANKFADFERILNEKEKNSYKKMFNELQKL